MVALYANRGVALAAAGHLGLPVEEIARGKDKTADFSSPLPWRKDEHPSCALLMRAGEEMVLSDLGDTHGRTYNLARLAMVQAYKKPPLKGKYGPELLVWRARLLVEAGILKPAPVPNLPPCPEGAAPTVKKVYEGFRLLLGCKWRVKEWAGDPTVFAKKFVAAWCGVSEKKANDARLKLAYQGIIHICDRLKGWRKTGLYLPGPHFKHPAYEGRKPTREQQLLREAEEKFVRRIARKLKVKGDPIKFSTVKIVKLHAKVRSARQLRPTDRFLFGCWVTDRLRAIKR